MNPLLALEKQSTIFALRTAPLLLDRKSTIRYGPSLPRCWMNSYLCFKSKKHTGTFANHPRHSSSFSRDSKKSTSTISSSGLCPEWILRKYLPLDSKVLKLFAERGFFTLSLASKLTEFRDLLGETTLIMEGVCWQELMKASTASLESTPFMSNLAQATSTAVLVGFVAIGCRVKFIKFFDFPGESGRGFAPAGVVS